MDLHLATDRMRASIEDGIGWMTFNNPARHNAMSLEMWQGIGDILERFQQDDAVRLVVMQGAGGKAFVSGADISEFDSKRSNAEQKAEYGRTSARGGRALAALSKPLIAKIEGYCIGGGLATALSADVRFATMEGRPLRAARSRADGNVAVPGLVGVVAGSRVTMTAYDGEKIEAQVVTTL